jgi:hydroxyacylglutathione hydrolase
MKYLKGIFTFLCNFFLYNKYMKIENVPKELILHQMELGPIANYLYFIGDANTNEIAIIDPAWDVSFLCEEAKKHGYTITSIFLTHGHPDHVNGLDEILESYDVPVYISKYEAPFLMPNHKNIIQIENGDVLKVGNLEFETILMPGHTPGCQSFKYKDVLIAGDALFIDGCGRCDLPGGDPRVQYNTLSTILMKLPDSTIIFPGHNYGPAPFATLSDQKQTNPYLTCTSEREFLVTRMGVSF